MSDAAAQLENFMGAVSKNRKQHKSVRSNINEVNSSVGQVALFFHWFVFKCSFVIETTGPSK